MSTVDVILMMAGAIGLVIALIVRNRHTEERVVERDAHAHLHH